MPIEIKNLESKFIQGFRLLNEAGLEAKQIDDVWTNFTNKYFVKHYDTFKQSAKQGGMKDWYERENEVFFRYCIHKAYQVKELRELSEWSGV